MTENVSEEQPNKLKTAYAQIVEDLFDLTVIQPAQVSKGIVQATLDNQMEIVNALASANKFIPVSDASETQQKALQYYANQLAQAKDISNKAYRVFAETTVAWQKVVVQSQRAAVDAYSAFLGLSAANVRAAAP